MATPTFNTKPGQTIAREQLITYINTGEYSNPKWAPLGRRVENSAIELDWDKNTIKDIMGKTYTTGKTPTMTQSFDEMPLDAGDDAAVHIWTLAVYEQNAQALMSQDMLLVHAYTDAKTGEPLGSWAERYDSSAVTPSSIGGEGGGFIVMPVDVDFGGTRTRGSAKKGEGGNMQFTPESEED